MDSAVQLSVAMVRGARLPYNNLKHPGGGGWYCGRALRTLERETQSKAGVTFLVLNIFFTSSGATEKIVLLVSFILQEMYPACFQCSVVGRFVWALRYHHVVV